MCFKPTGTRHTRSSWSDNGAAKFARLQEWASKMREMGVHDPLLWLDVRSCSHCVLTLRAHIACTLPSSTMQSRPKARVPSHPVKRLCCRPRCLSRRRHALIRLR